MRWPSPTRSTPSARAEDVARTAARHSGAHQGQHRHGRRMTTTAGSLALAGSIAAARRVHRRTAARGGRRHPRQDQPERVGELPLDALDRAAGAAAAARRKTRTRSTAIRRARAPGSGAAIAANLAAVGVGTETDGSIVSPSSVSGARRHQADAGSREPHRHHPDRAQPGHGRAHGPHGRRRRRPARRDGRQPIPRDPATSDSTRSGLRDYAKFLDPEGLTRRAYRRRAQASSATTRRRIGSPRRRSPT